MRHCRWQRVPGSLPAELIGRLNGLGKGLRGGVGVPSGAEVAALFGEPRLLPFIEVKARFEGEMTGDWCQPFQDSKFAATTGRSHGARSTVGWSPHLGMG
jgi:hypothetical protein